MVHSSFVPAALEWMIALNKRQKLISSLVVEDDLLRERLNSFAQVGHLNG